MRYQAVIMRNGMHLSSDYYSWFWSANTWVQDNWIEGDVVLMYELDGYEIVLTHILIHNVWRKVVKPC